MSSHSAAVASQVAELGRERSAWTFLHLWERGAALTALILLSPALAATAAAIVALSGRSPLVAHLRIGRFGVPFWTLKFRTMWACRASGGLRAWPVEYVVDEWVDGWKPAADPRVSSRFARFCRRFSIDELPQLWNVVRGEMALVGPRPLIEHEIRTYYGADAAEVLLAKPGITGLWQVMGRSRLTYEQRRRLDLFLVRNRSARLYLAILSRTLPVVLGGRDGW